MPHKRCSKCKTIKNINEFGYNPNTKDKLQSNCRECHRITNTNYRRSKGIIPREEYLLKVLNPQYTHRPRRKRNRNISRIDNWRMRKTEYINILGGGCIRCGIQLSEQWPVVCFEFHHSNKNKEMEITQLMLSSKEKVSKELIKCVILCANCHRIINLNNNFT